MRMWLLAAVALVVGGMTNAEGGDGKCPTPISDPTKTDDAVPAAPGSGSYVPPKLRKQTKPKYPAAARQKKIEGTVLLELLIDARGCVARVRVLESVPGLDEAAFDCVSKWRFKPAEEGGKPAPTIARVPIMFRYD